MRIHSPTVSLRKQRAIEATRGAVIDVLDGGVMAQPGIVQSGG